MSTPSAFPVVVVPPGEGKIIRAFGDELRLHLDGEKTGGKLALFSSTVAPGGGPPPHYHLNEDEWFMIQEGQARFFYDNAWHEVPVGAVIFAPRGSVHTFRNAGQTPLRMLIAVSPAGFETFIARVEALFGEEFNSSDMGALIALSAEYGIHYPSTT